MCVCVCVRHKQTTDSPGNSHSYKKQLTFGYMELRKCGSSTIPSETSTAAKTNTQAIVSTRAHTRTHAHTHTRTCKRAWGATHMTQSQPAFVAMCQSQAASTTAPNMKPSPEHRHDAVNATREPNKQKGAFCVRSQVYAWLLRLQQRKGQRRLAHRATAETNTRTPTHTHEHPRTHTSMNPLPAASNSLKILRARSNGVSSETRLQSKL